MHQYVRILRRCRHQKCNETLGLAHLVPSNKELAGITRALELDSDNYKIRITVCELLLDFVQVKVAQNWKPFMIGAMLFRNTEDIVKFMDSEIR